MSISGESVDRSAHPLFQEEGGGSIPTSPLALLFLPCSVNLAIRLNMQWHSRLPIVVHSNITRNATHVCYKAECRGLYYAVAIWTSPTNFVLPNKTWLELRRFAIAPDAPRNTASRMLGWMVRSIRQHFPHIERLISYQDCDAHKGTIYKASGWSPSVKSFEHRDRGKRAGRKRNNSQTTATKQRWELQL